MIAGLLGELGYPATERAVRDRLSALGPDDLVLLADGDAGMVALHRIPRLAEGDPIARITALVVSNESRRGGIGRALLGATERTAREWGCGLIEVSSGRRPERKPAHCFYRAAGFVDSASRSVRYWKQVTPDAPEVGRG